MPRTEIHIYDLFTLFKQIEKGDLRIPAFQREFVWKKKQITRLLESIYEGFPIGTLLLLRSAKKIFESSVFEINVRGSSKRKDYAIEVIDGAQRLRVLYNCLYIDSTKKDPAFNVGFDLKNKHFVQLNSIKSNYHIVALPAIFSSEKYINIQIRLSKIEDGEALLSEMNHLHSVFRDYRVPVIMLSDVNADDVVEIFQRLNTGGIALSKEEVLKALSQKPKKQ